MIIFNDKMQTFCSTKINGDSYLSGFGTKKLGDCKNIETIKKFFKEHQIIYKSIIRPSQSHSTNIKVVIDKVQTDSLIIEDTDGFITNQKNVIVRIITADCVPMLIADKKRSLIGASHQGWKGSYNQMAAKMIGEMVKLGSQLKDIIVVLGPAIGSCCYIIFDERLDNFRTKFKEWQNQIFTKTGEGISINLTLLNYLQLQKAGLKKEQIDFFPFCTSCDAERFYSYRRDHEHNYGHMMSYIMMK